MPSLHQVTGERDWQPASFALFPRLLHEARAVFMSFNSDANPVYVFASCSRPRRWQPFFPAAVLFAATNQKFLWRTRRVSE